MTNDPYDNFPMLKFIIRTLLIIAGSFLLFSSFLVLIAGSDDSTTFGFMWFSIMGSGLIIYFAVAALVIISIINAFKKRSVWGNVKRETLYLLVTISCFGLLGLINNYIVN